MSKRRVASKRRSVARRSRARKSGRSTRRRSGGRFKGVPVHSVHVSPPDENQQLQSWIIEGLREKLPDVRLIPPFSEAIDSTTFFSPSMSETDATTSPFATTPTTESETQSTQCGTSETQRGTSETQCGTSETQCGRTSIPKTQCERRSSLPFARQLDTKQLDTKQLIVVAHH